LRLKGAPPLFQPLPMHDTARPAAPRAAQPQGSDIIASRVVQ